MTYSMEIKGILVETGVKHNPPNRGGSLGNRFPIGETKSVSIGKAPNSGIEQECTRL